MGRPPCCDKEGVKKGPWTPEEDIILVSYIQEHGPGNWRSVPTNTGLLRCSKSCRLRWTNYLRPGIRRGNFTDQEEKLIVHLQALLGNRWAAIASYLPERTDNDIKNYWNTHLSKKLRRAGEEGGAVAAAAAKGLSKGQWERRVQADIHTAKQALREALCTTAAAPPPLPPAGVYASSTENISRLLKDWMRGSPGPGSTQLSSTGPGRAAESSSSSVCDENPAAACSSTPEASDGSRPEETQLSVLEKWLFDELSVSLEDDYGLF